MVVNGADLGHGMQLVPAAGHTPGHVALQIATSAEPVVITGDLLHHQCRFAHPEWSQNADHDQAIARETRSDFFSHHASHATLVAGTHFACAPFGRIEALGAAWRFRAVPGEIESPPQM